jgi:hypothetical protein
MLQKASSLGLAGTKLPFEFQAISSAVCSYLPTSAVVNSVNIVLGPGTGTWTGKVVGCVPDAMSSMMLLKASAAMTVGTGTKKFFDSVSFGVCQTILTTVMAQGTVIGGGPGSGTGKILGLIPAALESLIVAQLGGDVMVGSKTSPVIAAIAFGICNHIMTAGTIPTICVGVFAPPPAGPIPIPGAPGPGTLV